MEIGIEYKIQGIKVGYFNSPEDTKPYETKEASAIQSFARLDDKYYIAQRKGDNVFISTCSIGVNENILEFDANSTMRLNGFAHGQTFEFVPYNGKMYMLLGANVRKTYSQSLALVEYNAKKTVSYKDKTVKRITKLKFANQKRKELFGFGKVGRIDAALSENNKTLYTWVGNDKNGDGKPLKLTKVQIACYKMDKIIKYFENHPNAKSLSFQSMKKEWCNYSCLQEKKSQIIKPHKSSQGIEVSNTYKGKNAKGEEVNKNKVYFSSGDESKNRPMYICMMTLYKKARVI